MEIEVTRKRRGGIKRGESKLVSNHFPMCSPQSGSLRDIHGVTQRRKEGGRRQKWPGGEKGESNGERQIQPVISSLSVLHHLEHTEIHRVGWRKEGVGRRQRRPGGEKGESKEGESSQASNLTPK